MGGKSSGSNEAAQARADEQARQDRIRQGTERINSIFDGSTVGSGLLGGDAVYDPTKTYYLKDGSVWKPASGGGAVTGGGATTGGSGGLFGGSSGPALGGGGSSGGMFGSAEMAANPTSGRGLFGGPSMPGPRSRTAGMTFIDGNPYPSAPSGGGGGGGKSATDQFAEALASGTLYSGTQRQGGFGDEFFAGRRKAYTDYAMPQLQDQFGDAQEQLTFALARGGNLNSSTRAGQSGDLQKLYDLNSQQIGDQALSYETQARNAVEDARADLISTLNVTGDAEGAANAALARSQALSQPAAYSPLTQLFSDFTGQLGVQAEREKASAMSGGTYAPRYNTGLFGKSGRVTVTK